MNQEDKLKDKYGTSGAWRVPEGYFDSVFKEIGEKLPEYPRQPEAANLSVWERVKPYVCLAAMFAGIWLMMKVFHNVSGEGQLSLDNPPAQIAMAMTDQEEVALYSISDSFQDLEIEEKVSSEYTSIEDFKRDFGYALEPEYASISVEEEEKDE